MVDDLRSNKDIKIKKISIEGFNIKDLLKDEFIENLNRNLNDYTLLNFALILDEQKPMNLVSIGHTSQEDYNNNILTISAEKEENLSKFLNLL
jgi:hypothetical protein